MINVTNDGQAIGSETIISEKTVVSGGGDGVRNESIKFYCLLILILSVCSNSESFLKLILDFICIIPFCF